MLRVNRFLLLSFETKILRIKICVCVGGVCGCGCVCVCVGEGVCVCVGEGEGVCVYAPTGRARNEEHQKELQPGDFRTL